MKRIPLVRTAERRGFTLIEVMISLLILGIIGAAATRMLLAQGRFYDKQTNLRAARSIARSSMNVILNDLRMVQDSGGVDSATTDGRLLRVKVPYRFGLVCSTFGTTTTVSLLPNDSATNAMSTYAGFAWRNTVTGRYVVVTPLAATTLDKPTSSLTPSNCTGNGGGQARIRTVSVSGRSGSVVDLSAATPTGATPTAAMYLWERVSYSFKASTVYPGYYGLYRNVQGSAKGDEELLAPFDTSSRFRYYIAGDDTSRTTVPSLDQIRGVDLILNSISPNATSDNPTAHSPSKSVTSVFFKNVRVF
jgi:prepilin-type N-terminal cleavage/methylation domain-containing protein